MGCGGQKSYGRVEQGVLTRKYKPGRSVPQDSRVTDAHGAEFIKGLLTDELLTRVDGSRLWLKPKA
jgi:hypothetical protein